MRYRPGLGEGKLGCAIWGFILVLAGLIAFKAIPVKINAMELYDYMDDQARFGARVSTNALKTRVLNRAKELGLPVEPKDLSVAKTGGVIRMRCKFTVPVTILGFTYNWDFNLEVDRQVFIF